MISITFEGKHDKHVHIIDFSGEPFFLLFQPFPMYHVSTTWMQVVPKLSPKGRDLLQVYLTSFYLSCCTPIMLQVIDHEIYQLNQGLCSISDFIFNKET